MLANGRPLGRSGARDSGTDRGLRGDQAPQRPLVMTELTVRDLQDFGGEPRILDLVVAERLGFERPGDIGKLAERDAKNRGGLAEVA